MKRAFLTLAVAGCLIQTSHAQEAAQPQLQVAIVFTDPELGVLIELINDAVKNPSIPLAQAMEKTVKAAQMYQKIQQAAMRAQQEAQRKGPAQEPPQ